MDILAIYRGRTHFWKTIKVGKRCRGTSARKLRKEICHVSSLTNGNPTRRIGSADMTSIKAPKHQSEIVSGTGSGATYGATSAGLIPANRSRPCCSGSSGDAVNGI